MLLPPALGFSPHPPVSVYGTGTYYTIAAFLDSPYTNFPTFVRYASRFPVVKRIFQSNQSGACPGLFIPGFGFGSVSPQF